MHKTSSGNSTDLGKFLHTEAYGRYSAFLTFYATSHFGRNEYKKLWKEIDMLHFSLHYHSSIKKTKICLKRKSSGNQEGGEDGMSV